MNSSRTLLEVGQSASLCKQISAEDLRIFADLSMDRNPIHLDDKYAETTVFKKTIAHGLYVASFISATIANHLPGVGSIYLSQDLRFKKPVYVGDTVTAEVKIIEIPKPTLYRLSTTCVNQYGDVVIEGHALVKKE